MHSKRIRNIALYIHAGKHYTICIQRKVSGDPERERGDFHAGKSHYAGGKGA